VICNRHRGLLSKWALLLHDNARPNSATATVEGIRELKFELILHARIIRT
jgi:hypothetical protein